MTSLKRTGAIRATLATITLASLLLAISSVAPVASADHSWGGYHWARTTNPFTLLLGDNVASTWDGHLILASSDWSASSVLDTFITTGSGGRNCKAKSGRVEVCNGKYGNNGWLGLATIWISGSHITQGTVKVNDTYFNTPTYNTPAWRQLVMCQEIAHTFGLDHQDENFGNANLNSCMDYTNSPESNQHPNQHDFDQLELIYAHLDSVTTVGTLSDGGGGSGRGKGNGATSDSNDPSAWGTEIHRSADGRSSIFEEKLSTGKRVLRHVFWAEPRGHLH